MRKRLACALLACLVGPGVGGSRAWGEPLRFTMAPGSVQVGFRAYGLGMLAIDGGFTRFSGVLTLDDADRGFCAVDLRAETASLRMPSEAMTADAQGADLLDVGRYPAFRFEGRCVAGRVVGTLLLHGVTKPLTLEVREEKGVWTAQGLMRRADWGMGARPLLAGPEVRITITAGLPAARAGR